MIKVVIGAIIMFSMTYIGIGLDGYYKARLDLITEICEFIRHAKREVSLLKTDFLSILLGFSSENKHFKKLVDDTKACVENNEDLNVECVYLNSKALASFKSFLVELMRADYTSHEQVFMKAREEFEVHLNCAIHDKKNKGELLRKLLALFGVGVVLMLL